MKKTRNCPSSMHCYAKLSEPKPSYLFPILKYFAKERHSIYLNRLKNHNKDWTQDKIFIRHKFTNTFRACDRVSQFLINNIIEKNRDEADEDLFLRIITFKVLIKFLLGNDLNVQLVRYVVKHFRPQNTVYSLRN